MRSWMVVAVCALAGCASTPVLPQTHVDPDLDLLRELELIGTFPELRLETDHGPIRMVLYTAWTPQTAAHIAALAQRGFYDGTLIHRVVDDFVIQGGDPTGTGEGGSGPLGTPDPVPLELHELDFGSGAVGLARWTDDTGDSQYFITEKPALHLSRPSGTTGQVFGAYALFGQVFEGMDVVRAIAAVETVPHLDRPVTDVIVRDAKLLPPSADLDRIGLIPLVHDGEGMLELPRRIVAGHPALLRFTGSEPCPEPPPVPGAAWMAVDHDACTFEAHVAFTPGTHRIGELDIEVGGWHEAYREHAGAWAERVD